MSNKQIKILRNIRKYKRLYLILKKCSYTSSDYLEFQENFPDGSGNYMMFSDRRFNECTTVSLTPKAESILDENKMNRFRFWLPLIVSAAAFAVSAAAFVKSFFY